MSRSPAHHAVEHQDLPQLRDLLGAGHDVEDDADDRWALLRHATDAEHDRHPSGEPCTPTSPRSCSPAAPIRYARAPEACPPSSRPNSADTRWPPRSCKPGSSKAETGHTMNSPIQRPASASMTSRIIGLATQPQAPLIRAPSMPQINWQGTLAKKVSPGQRLCWTHCTDFASRGSRIRVTDPQPGQL